MLDRWIASATASLVTFVRTEMEGYRLYTVVPKLVNFIGQLTNVYVRYNRSRLKGKNGDGDTRRALAALYDVLLVLCKTMAPFTPFFAENMYQNLKRCLPDGGVGEPSVHFTAFPEARSDSVDERVEALLSLMTVEEKQAQTIHSTDPFTNTTAKQFGATGIGALTSTGQATAASLEEQNKILAAKRSNNELDCSKLVNALPDMRIPDIHTAMAECMQRTKKNLDAQGWKPTPRGK